MHVFPSHQRADGTQRLPCSPRRAGIVTISQLTDLTLPLSDRAAANIPLTATKFAFVYPVTQCANLTIQQRDSIRGMGASDLLMNGGFIYVDSNGKRVGLNAVMSSYGSDESVASFRVDGPWTLKPDVRTSLKNDGLLQPVTLPALRDQGAHEFGWAIPDAPGSKSLGEVEATHGAFVYTDQGGKGVYLRLVPKDEPHAKVSSAPLPKPACQGASLL